MPHFEKVTQIKADYPGLPFPKIKIGLTMKEKQAVTMRIRSRYQKAGRKLTRSATVDRPRPANT
jgi:hypothetical protein